jgi:hypothetical protein
VPRSRSEAAEFVIESIRSLGFNPDNSSRLMSMHRILTEDAGVIPPTHPRFKEALEADRDFLQLSFILEQQHAAASHPGLIALLRPLCQDATLPEHSAGGKTKGRDTQLELFAAALCQAAGFMPVDYVEPDVVCRVANNAVGVACKRIKNPERTVKNIRKARDQIVAAEMPGVIVVETTIALNPNNVPLLTPVPDEVLKPMYRAAMTRYVAEHLTGIYAALSRAPIGGIIFHDSILRFESDGNWGLTAMTFHLPLICDLDLMRLFEAFKSGYGSALPNVEDINES